MLYLTSHQSRHDCSPPPPYTRYEEGYESDLDHDRHCRFERCADEDEREELRDRARRTKSRNKELRAEIRAQDEEDREERSRRRRQREEEFEARAREERELEEETEERARRERQLEEQIEDRARRERQLQEEIGDAFRRERDLRQANRREWYARYVARVREHARAAEAEVRMQAFEQDLRRRNEEHNADSIRREQHRQQAQDQARQPKYRHPAPVELDSRPINDALDNAAKAYMNSYNLRDGAQRRSPGHHSVRPNDRHVHFDRRPHIINEYYEDYSSRHSREDYRHSREDYQRSREDYRHHSPSRFEFSELHYRRRDHRPHHRA